MPEYIEREALIAEINEEIEHRTPMYTDEQNDYIEKGLRIARKDIKRFSATDVVEVVRCGNCKFATELDKHCELNRAIYKHCSLVRGEPTNYVWHKYKRYYKNYSLVEADDYCSYGERKDDDK